MKIKNRILSLVFPVLSIAISTILILIAGFNWLLMTFICGLVLSGLFPIAIITVGKTDLSIHFKGKLNLFLLFTVLNVISLLFSAHGLLKTPFNLIAPVIALIAEMCFAISKGSYLKDKAALFFSNLNIVYIAFLVDFSHGWMTNAPWF